MFQRIAASGKYEYMNENVSVPDLDDGSTEILFSDNLITALLVSSMLFSGIIDAVP